jgi:ArsR family transcriptional regulator
MKKNQELKLTGDIFQNLSDFFKVMGDFTRLRIIHFLSDREMNVNEIAAELGMEQSAISHQLRILKQSRLVKYRREGKQVFYSLDDQHVRQVFIQGLEHVME